VSLDSFITESITLTRNLFFFWMFIEILKIIQPCVNKLWYHNVSGF